MAWGNIDLSPELTEHPKMVKLAASLGSRFAAMGHLGLLWCWTSRYAKNGRITVDLSFLEGSVLDWKGEPGRLIAALTDSGFIDRRKLRDGTESLSVHNWKKRNAHIEAFRRLQSDKAKARWSEKRHKSTNGKGLDEMPGHMPGDIPSLESGNASIYPSIPSLPPLPSHPSRAPQNGDEGARAPRRPIDLTGLIGLHMALFKRQPTKAQRIAYQSALGELGTERARWEYAFTIGRQKEARTPDYVITTARNLEPKDWGAIETRWPKQDIEAAQQTAAAKVAAMTEAT